MIKAIALIGVGYIASFDILGIGIHGHQVKNDCNEWCCKRIDHTRDRDRGFTIIMRNYNNLTISWKEEQKPSQYVGRI